ncbi:MAG: hypothetical protein GXY83_29945 [Rhodopirellula sp.]|nr:hypothetical protein [Rhodopirellula sp.]
MSRFSAARARSVHSIVAEDGLAILGFPCNQFLGQEPGTAEEIREFCRVNYGVKFDMFAKVEVNGDGACDLYKTLTALDTKPVGAGKISWNFEKFVVGRNGEVVARFSPRTRPDAPEVRDTRMKRNLPIVLRFRGGSSLPTLRQSQEGWTALLPRVYTGA